MTGRVAEDALAIVEQVAEEALCHANLTSTTLTLILIFALTLILSFTLTPIRILGLTLRLIFSSKLSLILALTLILSSASTRSPMPTHVSRPWPLAPHQISYHCEQTRGCTLGNLDSTMQRFLIQRPRR